MKILITACILTLLGVCRWNLPLQLTSYCLQGPRAVGTDLYTARRKVQEVVTEILGRSLRTILTFSYGGTSTRPDLKRKYSQLFLMKIAIALMPIGLCPTISAHSNMKLQLAETDIFHCTSCLISLHAFPHELPFITYLVNSYSSSTSILKVDLSAKSICFSQAKLLQNKHLHIGSICHLVVPTI